MDLVSYAILRRDIDYVTAGKAASQAGHAFLASYLTAPPYVSQAFIADEGGTKIVLLAEGEAQLRDIHAKAKTLGLPCALWIESGHVMPPTFDGAPIVTAVGIGPAERWQMKHLTKGLKLFDDGLLRSKVAIAA